MRATLKLGGTVESWARSSTAGEQLRAHFVSGIVSALNVSTGSVSVVITGVSAASVSIDFDILFDMSSSTDGTMSAGGGRTAATPADLIAMRAATIAAAVAASTGQSVLSPLTIVEIGSTLLPPPSPSPPHGLGAQVQASAGNKPPAGGSVAPVTQAEATSLPGGETAALGAGGIARITVVGVGVLLGLVCVGLLRRRKRGRHRSAEQPVRASITAAARADSAVLLELTSSAAHGPWSQPRHGEHLVGQFDGTPTLPQTREPTGRGESGLASSAAALALDDPEPSIQQRLILVVGDDEGASTQAAHEVDGVDAPAPSDAAEQALAEGKQADECGGGGGGGIRSGSAPYPPLALANIVVEE